MFHCRFGLVFVSRCSCSSAGPLNATCVRPQEEARGHLDHKRVPACSGRMLLLLLAACIQGADAATFSPSAASGLHTHGGHATQVAPMSTSDHLTMASESGTTQVAISDAAGAQAVIYALRDQIHALKAENQQIDVLKAQVQQMDALKAEDQQIIDALKAQVRQMDALKAENERLKRARRVRGLGHLRGAPRSAHAWQL